MIYCGKNFSKYNKEYSKEEDKPTDFMASRIQSVL